MSNVTPLGRSRPHNTRSNFPTEKPSIPEVERFCSSDAGRILLGQASVLRGALLASAGSALDSERKQHLLAQAREIHLDVVELVRLQEVGQLMAYVEGLVVRCQHAALVLGINPEADHG